jgi:hypothetical protein
MLLRFLATQVSLLLSSLLPVVCSNHFFPYKSPPTDACIEDHHRRIHPAKSPRSLMPSPRRSPSHDLGPWRGVARRNFPSLVLHRRREVPYASMVRALRISTWQPAPSPDSLFPCSTAAQIAANLGAYSVARRPWRATRRSTQPAARGSWPARPARRATAGFAPWSWLPTPLSLSFSPSLLSCR